MASFMDIGPIGNEDAVFKRKFRWDLSFTGYPRGAAETLWMAFSSKRPTLNIAEQAINHMHETHYLSGRPTWDTFSMNVYDVKKAGAYEDFSGGEKIMHEWLNSVYTYTPDTGKLGLSNYNQFDMGSWDTEYKRDLRLRLYDGHGKAMETWYLLGCFPTSVNFGDLSYDTNDTANIDITLRFDRAEFYPGAANTNSKGAADV